MKQDDSFVEVYRPRDQFEVGLIRAALADSGIGYYITNENLSAVLPVPAIAEMALKVERERATECRWLLRASGLAPLPA